MSEEPTGGAGLSRSTAVMASGTAVSRVLGLVRNALLLFAVGLTESLAADAFAVANWLPNVFYMLLAGGVVNAVLVPQVVRAYRSKNGQEYVDRLLTLSFVVMGAATLVLTLASPLVIRLLVSDAEQAGLATMFALWCMPQIFFYGAYTMLGQVLNARAVFGPYMWAPVANNVVAIAGLIAFLVVFGTYQPGTGDDLSVWDGGRVALLAGSATLGVVVQAAVLVLPLRRIGFRYRPRGRWRGAGLGTAGRVAGWTFAALAVGQVGVLVVMRVAAAASATQVPGVAGNNAYNQAFGIFMLPHSLVTVSLITALFTRLSDHAAARETRAVRADFSQGLRTIAVFTLFAAPGLAVLAVPLVRALYPSTTEADATSMAPIIVAFMCGLAAVGAWALCQRVFYAYEDAKGLFRIQVVMAGVVVAGAVLGWLVAPPQHWVAWSAGGIAASYVVGAVWGGAQVWRRLGGGLSRIVRLHVRAGLAAAVATGTGWLVSRVFGNLAAASWPKAVLACVVVGGLMLVLYAFLLRRLGVTELDDFLRPLVGRLGRSMRTPGPAAASAAVGTVGTVDAEGAAATGTMGAVGATGVIGTVGATGVAAPAAAAGPYAASARAGDVWTPDHGHDRGGDRLDAVIGRGTLLAGRYRLHQPVASDLPGAETWTARDQILDRPVRAVILTVGGDVVGRAQDAARRAALVSDPRLLRVLDVGDHEGIAYVVTEPVVGQDLAQLTANGPLPADQARAVVGEAAAALEVARRRGVHHLALRPAAVHVTPDGGILVSGLAMDGELFGNSHGDAKTTSRADTVGLVSLLYLALTGRWPTAPGTVPVSGPPHAPSVEGTPVPPAELSPAVPNDLDTLCAVTLGPHDDGPHSPGELVRELEPWVAVDGAAIYDALDATTRHVTLPSGPWDGDGRPGGPGGPGGDGLGAGGGGASTLGTVAGAAAGGAAAGAVAGAATRPAAGSPAATVQRQSVRQAIGTPTARPGTPPSAPAPRTAAGAAHPPGVRPPAVPPATRPPAAIPPPGRPGGTGAGGFDDLLREPVPITRRQVNATPIVLTIIGVLVVVGLVWAWRSLTAPAPPIGGEGGFGIESPADDAGEEGEDAPGTEGTDEGTDEGSAAPSQEAPSGGPPVIASAQMIDPPPGGDNNEHPEAVDRAIDGDPTTYWFTRTYVSPTFGMKPGVGYAVTLQEEATVSQVRLQVNGTGGMVEVRITDPSTPTEGPVLASGALGPDTVLTLSQPTAGRHVVLWFTALPQTPDGRNRVELLEVQVS